jgi:hypothetical protein
MSNSVGMLVGDDPAGRTDLREEIDRAEAFTSALQTLAERVLPGELLFAWLFGRDEEVRVVVAAILADWSAGDIDAETATCRLRTYLDELEERLETIWRRGELTRRTRLASASTTVQVH